MRDYLVLAAIAVFAVASVVAYGRAGDASDHAAQVARNLQGETRARGRQRVKDERAACRNTSRHAVAELTLHWTYYQSEAQLAVPGVTAEQMNAALATLSPGERGFIALLIRSGRPSRKILKARADADRNAAAADVRAIDYRDVGLIPAKTALGSEVTPRRWAAAVHYSCDGAFS
jgi:hypothetical protein